MVSHTASTTPLRRLLHERGVSIKRLAEMVNADREHVGRVVNGLRQPSNQLRQRIAACLGVDIVSIFPPDAAGDAVERRVRELVEVAPPLTPDQRMRLAVLLLIHGSTT